MESSDSDRSSPPSDSEGRDGFDENTHENDLAGGLIAGIRRGDPEAFDTFFRAYYGQLFAFAMSYGARSEDVAEDIVCEVFTWVWRNRETWEPRASVDSYLYGAVRNKIQNLRRDTLRDFNRRHRMAGMNEIPGSSQEPLSIDLQIEKVEISSIVRNCVSQLPDTHRLIVLLRWERQWSWTQIAEAIGVTAAAAQMQHQRALKSLRNKLPDHLIK